MSTITQSDFYELPEVVALINIQKTNKFGSEPHRNAYIEVHAIADEHGVGEHFGTLEEYDS